MHGMQVLVEPRGTRDERGRWLAQDCRAEAAVSLTGTSVATSGLDPSTARQHGRAR
jgi:hypothetical protein